MPRLITREYYRLYIKERSLPENAIDFYQPIFEWIYNYVDQPKNVTTFNFKLEYFSTSSAKQITKIFFLLEKLSDNNEVIVNWYYKKEDLDMYSSGLKYSKLTNLKFNLLEY